MIAVSLSSWGAAHGATYVADPAASDGPRYYESLVERLRPGDTLVLPAGTYRRRLNLQGLHGARNAWITITGPTQGPPAIVTTDSTCCNAVQLGDTSYVALKHLNIDTASERVGASIDGINTKGGPTHDILVENCVISGAGFHQATVGISTKSLAWNWTVRGNTVLRAGTGAYFGNYDGSAPFVAGLIERNMFVDTLGYNLQIKYQKPYEAPEAIPAGARRTIIRHNVFMKRVAQSRVPAEKIDGPRPNLLVGGFPEAGAGAEDHYEIYGNLFLENQDGESLLQASGRLSIHDNVFVGGTFGVVLQDHDLPLKRADVYHNTIYVRDYGIRFGNGAAERSSVAGNLVFAEVPISGPIHIETSNLVGPLSAARTYLVAPSTDPGTMSFYPLPERAAGEPLDLTPYALDTAYDRDFDSRPKGDGRYRGAFAGTGTGVLALMLGRGLPQAELHDIE